MTTAAFWYLLGGAAYGVLITLVAVVIGKSIKLGRGEDAPAGDLPDGAVDLLADQPTEILTDAGQGLTDVEVDARFRQIIRPEFTWETWL